MIAVRTDYFVLRNTVCPDFDARTAMTDWMRALLRALLLCVAAASVLLAQQSAAGALARRILHPRPATFRQSAAVHAGAGSMAFTALLNRGAVTPEFNFLHRGVIPPG